MQRVCVDVEEENRGKWWEVERGGDEETRCIREGNRGEERGQGGGGENGDSICWGVDVRKVLAAAGKYIEVGWTVDLL